jgi:hypothetical protein
VCARVFYLLLAAVFVYVTVTVAAFVYLPWWAAVLTSALTFVSLVAGGKMLGRWWVRSLVGRAGDVAQGMFDVKSRVLRGATVDVHSVRPADPPRELVEWARTVHEEGDADERADAAAQVEDRAWYQFEVTIFPDPAAAGPMGHWDLDDLRVVPAGARPRKIFDADGDDGSGEESELHEPRVIQDGVAVEPVDAKFTGPQRLRFVAGLPKGVKEAQFRYYFEDFGAIRIPQALPGRGPVTP